MLTRRTLRPCAWNLYHRPWQPAKEDAPHYVDNVKTKLTQPGQFYYVRPPRPCAQTESVL
jgi:hypothetical protein